MVATSGIGGDAIQYEYFWHDENAGGSGLDVFVHYARDSGEYLTGTSVSLAVYDKNETLYGTDTLTGVSVDPATYHFRVTGLFENGNIYMGEFIINIGADTYNSILFLKLEPEYLFHDVATKAQVSTITTNLGI